ncbi:MAG TPA: hypothetical protein VGJ02_09000 [Pyrinomonadaceae bacterium]
MGILGKFFRRHRAGKAQTKAIDLEYDHKYAEAAQVYADRAKLDLPDNELIFADDCIDSFKNWIKAGNREEALNEARRALQGYLLGDWLTDDGDDDGENLKTLKDLIDDLREAGYTAEADAFLADVNNALVKFGRKPVSIVVVSTEFRFPDICPHCGGAITYRGHLDEIDCPFCSGHVRALGPAN